MGDILSGKGEKWKPAELGKVFAASVASIQKATGVAQLSPACIPVEVIVKVDRNFLLRLD